MDDKEFEHIVPLLRVKAMAAARGCGLDGDEAEDVAQDVLLKLWSIRGDLGSCSQSADGASRRVEALAYVAARNLSLDRQRRRRTVPMTDRPVVDDCHPQPDTMLEIADGERWLERRMASLPSTEYHVLRLRQLERRTDAEIAAILGIGEGSVSTILSRARRKLLEAMRRRNQY